MYVCSRQKARKAGGRQGQRQQCRRRHKENEEIPIVVLRGERIGEMRENRAPGKMQVCGGGLQACKVAKGAGKGSMQEGNQSSCAKTPGKLLLSTGHLEIEIEI